jgi:type 1 glutamine amidotransferase
MRIPLCLCGALVCLAFLPSRASAENARTAPAKIVLLAGGASHGPGDHEHYAGMMVLSKCLKEIGGIDPVVVRNGWPEDEKVFDGAKAVAIFSDGRGGHPLVQGRRGEKYPRWEFMRKLMEKGVGLAFIHYAVDFDNHLPAPMLDDVFEWMGGRYEDGYSTNPINKDVEVTPAAKEHPVCRGLEPYKTSDEFYYRIRFKPEDKRVTPILTFVPANEPGQGRQTIAWATERSNGGRSFGFTGGHFHKNWGVEGFRRMVLSALLWIAKVDVPAGGAKCNLTEEDLKVNLDDKGGKKR